MTAALAAPTSGSSFDTADRDAKARVRRIGPEASIQRLMFSHFPRLSAELGRPARAMVQHQSSFQPVAEKERVAMNYIARRQRSDGKVGRPIVASIGTSEPRLRLLAE